MDNSFNYYLHKNKNKSNHTSSESILQHYSIELQNFKDALKKNKQNNRIKNNTILPAIKSISREPKNKKNLFSIYASNKANELEQRLCKLQKDKFAFSRNHQINSIFEIIDKNAEYRNMQSLQRFSNPFPMPQIILQPLVISMGNTAQNSYNPNFPNQNFANNSYNFNNNFQQNINQNQNYQIQKNKQIETPKISQVRRKYLKRRIRIICMSVYFIFLFKTYSRIVTYKRYQRYLQLDPIMKEHQTLQNFLFEKYLKFDIYNRFYKISRAEQTKSQYTKYQVQINYDNEIITLNLKVGQIFLADLLKTIEKQVEKGQFKILNPIFMNFLDRGFPLPFMHLHPQFGWMYATPEVSKILIIVYFFVKIFIFQLVGNKQILAILHKVYRKNWAQKKYILLYGKKLTATMIVLYSVINNIFFTTMKRQVESNFQQMPNSIKPQPMNQLVCELNISEQKPNVNKKQIIKQLYCDQNHRNLFIEIFQQNWKKIRKIAQMLYDQSSNEKTNQTIILKKQALEEGFIDRKILLNLRKKNTSNVNQNSKSKNKRK